MLTTLLILAGMTVVAAAAHNARAVAAAKSVGGLRADYVALAKKWAAYFNVPWQWVLATILVESGGKASAVNPLDRGTSVGLMQVNMSAHADLLRSVGINPDPASAAAVAALQAPDVNIKLGTKILRAKYDLLARDLTEHGVAAPPYIDAVVRLLYRGVPGTLPAVRAGQDPRSLAPDTVARWNAALAKVNA